MGSDEKLLRDIEHQWNTLTIANDFVFGKVMRDESICRDVLEAILGVPIERIEYVGTQEEISETPESRGVRLDAYVRDGRGTVYDIEMQATNTRELPQRSRYYHALLALAQLEKGTPYRRLKDSYVIFICGFDLFDEGRRVYSFMSRDSRTGRALEDGVHTLFLSAASPAEPDQGERVNELLDYVASGVVAGNLSARIDEAVSHVRDNREWRLEFMIQAVKDQLNIEKGRDLGFQEGRAAGIEEGREVGIREGRETGIREGREAGIREGREAGIREGREAGEQQLGSLITHLLADGRMDDIARATSDPAMRERLYAEYGLI